MPSPEKVLLVHGMGRSAASMLLMSRRLKESGLPTTLFNYFVSLEDLDTISARMMKSVRRFRGRPFALVAHSLGGVLARMNSRALTDAGLCRLVLMGTPNHTPVMARAFKDNPLFRMLAGDAGQKLATPSFHETLPIPAIPTLSFAGSSGPRSRWLPFKGEENDGVVSVGETQLEGAENRVVPGIHTFLMTDRSVTDEIIRFLQEEAG